MGRTLSLVCIRILAKYIQSGAVRSPYSSYRESKPYVKDKVEWWPRFSFLCLFNLKYTPHRRAIDAKLQFIMAKDDDLRLCENLEEVLKEQKFKYWDVDIDGNISYKGKEGAHQITGDMLLSQNWLTHMLKKWKGIEKDALPEFYFAYMRALRNKGIQSITLSVENEYKLIK